MKALIIDGANFVHRARSGFKLGPYCIVYNFFRALKPLVEQFKPGRVYFTLEGAPKRQLALLPEYKANRSYDGLESFHRQRDLIVGLLRKHFPVSVVQHPGFEGDDVVYNLVKNSSSAVSFTVVSTDTDFTQLLQRFKNVDVFNPVTKGFVQAPAYDYVTWKALRGDPSDNIPGIVTDAEATRLLEVCDGERFDCWVRDSQHPERARFFTNEELIRFKAWTTDEAMLMTSSTPTRDWDAVRSLFEAWLFKSMLKPSYWDKFQATFDALWPMV